MKIARKLLPFCLLCVFVIPSPFLTFSSGDDSPSTREWGNLGLYGGQIYDFEFDHSNPDRIFAGAYYGDGLFLTTNSGAAWQPVLTGDEGGDLDGEATFRNTAVWAVKMASSDSNRVWAVHNFWAEFTIDGGAAWNHIFNSQMQRDCTNCGGTNDQWRFCRSLAIDPDDPDRVYVGTGGAFGAVAGGAIYRTEDGGDTWTKTGFDENYEFDNSVVDIAIDPGNPENVWAISTTFAYEGQQGALYQSTNYGAIWSQVDLENFNDTNFHDLVLWPDNPSIVLIATESGILSNISGTWLRIYSETVNALAFDPNNSNILYAAVGSKGIVRAKYNSTSGKFVFGPIADVGLDFLTLEVDPSDGDVIFGGELKKGVFKFTYDSSGDDFTVIDQNNGINAIGAGDIDVIPASLSSPVYLIAATGSGVSYRIGDGNWTPASTQDLPELLIHAVAFDPTDSDGSSFYAGGDGFLAKTSDRGETWAVNETDIPSNMRVSDITVDTNGSTLYITTRNFSGSGGHVYKSTNSGLSLVKKLASSEYEFNTVLIDPTNPNRILAGGGNYFAPRKDGNLHVSFNGGNTWSLTGLTDVIVNALLVDPADPSIIYAGCGYSGGTKVPLYKSNDGGFTWQASYDGIPGRPVRRGIWGSAADDVFALGHSGSIVKGGYDDMRIMHFDGTNWSGAGPISQSNVLDHLNGIWGAANNDIYAVGENGAIVHYDGTEWSPMEDDNNRTTIRNLNGVWGYSATNVYVVGEGGTILHFGGSGWDIMNSPTTTHLYGVWGHSQAGSHRVYAVGAIGTILRFEDGSWSTMASGVKAMLSGIWGTPDGSAIFAVGDPAPDPQGNIRHTILKFSGSSWSRMNAPIVGLGQGRLSGVWGTSSENVFAVGDDGIILYYNGTNWSKMTSGTMADFLGIWGASADQVYAVGRYGTIQYYDGTTWIPKDILPSGQTIEWATNWNAVTDLKFKLDPGGNHNVYAATNRQGIYFSPNQGQSWINLLAPPYSISALEVGSIYVASTGVYAYQGLGYIVGEVKDILTGVGLSQASVTTESGVSGTTNSEGLYVLYLNAGLYNITGDATGYKPETAYDVPSKKDGNVVNFFLTDPPVFVKINGADILGTNGDFNGTTGNITPIDGDYDWTESGASGFLQVPYPYGWVKLAIEPHEGHQIMDVLVNGEHHGPITEYSFYHPSTSQTIEVLFGPKTSLCKADLNQDGDVDGLDAAGFALGVQNGATLNDLADEFGRTDCLP